MAAMLTHELHAPPALEELDALTTEVKDWVKAADWQTFIVAMTVVVGGGYMLASASVSNDVKIVAASFIGAIVSYFFGNKISTATAAATIAASAGAASQAATASAQGAAQGGAAGQGGQGGPGGPGGPARS